MLVENPTRITEAKIKRMAKQAKGRITAIYLHWTAGRRAHPGSIGCAGETDLTCVVII